MAFRAFDRSLPSFYLLITRRALWITRRRVPHSLRARWSLRVRPWITAGRYPPASLRLLAFFKCWMGYLASAVSNTPPAALPGATRRREARGAGVAGCALRPCPHSHRLSATVQRQGAVPSLRCGPHQPLDPAPSQESFSKHPESLCAAFSRGGPCSPYCLHAMAHYRPFLAVFQRSRSSRWGWCSLPSLVGWPTTSAARRQQVAPVIL